MKGGVSKRATRIGIAIVFLLGAVFTLTNPTYGQVAGATLSGVVTDPSGSVIAGVKVSVRNTATGVVTEISANSDGFYSAPNLLPGEYEVTMSATGFQTIVNAGVVLTVGAQQVLNISLKVGDVAQKVVVTGEAPAIELASSDLSGVINSRTVVDLPLNGRDWTTLAVLEPGVNQLSTQQPVASAANRSLRGYGIALTVSGTRPTLNNYRIDGISVVDYAGGGPGSVTGFAAGVDAIGEFSVITSNYDAEYGKTGGGVINAITRSGSDSFHGNAYGFLRSGTLDARNFFDGAKIPPFHRDQYGGSVGGPIKKNKTFFFVNYEAFRQGLGVTFKDQVPSPDARNGILHNPDGSTTNVTIDPTTQTYLQFWPLPNGGLIGTGNTGFFNTAVNQVAKDNFVTTRLDHKFSDKDSLSGTYLFATSSFTTPDALVTVNTPTAYSRDLIAISETHVFSSSFTNNARFGYTRANVDNNGDPTAIIPLAEQPGLGAFPGTNAAGVTVTGLTAFAGGVHGVSFNHFYWNTYQFSDDAFYVRGNHSIKFGVSVEKDQDNIHKAGNTNGKFGFSSLQNFLTNNASSFSGTNSENFFHFRQSIVGAYVQDDWRIRPNLTINLGMRYEMATELGETDNQLANLRTLSSATNFVGAPFYNNPTLRNFAPRVGLAWDPFKNGKTAVRAAFGQFDLLPYQYYFWHELEATYPFVTSIVTGALPQGAFPFGVTGGPFNSTKTEVSLSDFNPKRNYMMVWNLNIQQQITPSITATVGYVGNHGVHMINRADDYNTVLPSLTPTGDLFPLPGTGTKVNTTWGDVRGTMGNGTALYDALQASLLKRFSHGFQAQVSYTWGKGLDTGSAATIGDDFENSISSPYFFWQGRKGLTDFNVAQTLVVNYIWTLPVPRDQGAFVTGLLGGYQLGGILTVQTGQPFTPLISGDPLGTGSSDPFDFPDRLTGPGCGNPINPGNPNGYIKTSCFGLPTAPDSFAAQCAPFPGATTPAPAGQVYCANLLGNVGRNSLIGPGLVNFDFSLFKNNYIRRISENFNIQLRAEVFNLFNHTNFQLPLGNSTLFNATGAPVGAAGVINSTSTPSREAQFGVKVIF
ncbi:MAG: TonB-dependent receptor [Candidatus Acidiferrales bacterium]